MVEQQKSAQTRHNKASDSLEKDIKKKDQQLTDFSKQIATARAYIISLEHKINEMKTSQNIQGKAVEDPTDIQPLVSREAESNKVKIMEQRIQDMESSLHELRMSTLEHKMEQTQQRLEGVENSMRNITLNSHTQSRVMSSPFLDKGAGIKDPPWVEKENNKNSKSSKNGKKGNNRKRWEKGQKQNMEESKNRRGQEEATSSMQNHTQVENVTAKKPPQWQQATISNACNVMGLVYMQPHPQPLVNHQQPMNPSIMYVAKPGTLVTQMAPRTMRMWNNQMTHRVIRQTVTHK